MSESAYSVFICYSSEHRAFALEVFNTVKEAGCDPKLDDVMVTSTTPHDSQSAAHIQDDDCVVVVLPASFPSWLPATLTGLQGSRKKRRELTKEISHVVHRMNNDPSDPVILIMMQEADRTPTTQNLPKYLKKLAGVIEEGAADWRAELKERMTYLRTEAADVERRGPDLQRLQTELAYLATEWRYGRSGGSTSSASGRALSHTRHVDPFEYQPAYYVQLQGKALRSADKPGEQAVASTTDAIEWILRGERRHGWVVGDAGSGKTIAMTRAASEAADKWIEWSRGKDTAREAGTDGPRLPILMTCASFYPTGTGKDADAWRGVTAKALAKRMARPSGRSSLRSLLAELNKWNCLLLLDGLDEVPDRRAVERITQTIQFLQKSSAADLRVVVSTRADDLRLSPAESDVMKLEPFGYQRGVELVKKIADASGSLGGRVIQVEKLLEENRTSEKFETLTNPLLITIACLLAKEPYSGPLQTKIGALLDRVLSRLCPCDAGQVIGRPELRALALEAMRQAEHQPPLPRVVDILNAAVSDAGIVIDTVAREFERVSGIVRVERASDKNDFIDFRHPYFLEYLTAEAVGEWPVENLLTRLRSEIPLWLRVAKFLPGLFARRKALASAYTFLAQLAAEARSAATEAPAIWLAGLSGVVDDRDLQQSEGARRFACEARKAVDEAAGNWSDHSRAEVLDACGLAAHPYYLKDIFRPQWIDVPEYSSRRISVANAPVTVADYARFLSSSSKDDKDLWRPEAPKDPKQRFVDKADEQGWQEQLKTPVRPVTYVTWYEAMAYCAWRTKLDKTGGIVRLPTPAEWKVIARPGGVAHEYPWGEGAPRGNYRDVGLQRPSPVGLFPACCRPRLLDFGTNICEWSQESAIAKLDEEEVLGGSWGDLTDYLRICRKERFRKREYRRPDCGFRCLLEQNV